MTLTLDIRHAILPEQPTWTPKGIAMGQRKKLIKGLFTVNQACEMVGLSRRTISRYQAKNLVPTRYTFLGNLRVCYFTEQDIEQILSVKNKEADRQGNIRAFVDETREMRKQADSDR